MELDKNLQQILQSFMDVCDSVVERAYVVTNGIRIAGIVLQEDLAHHICKKVIATYQEEEQKKVSNEWVVCDIPHALQYAFERGYNSGMMKAEQEISKSLLQTKPSCKEVSEKEKLVQEPIRENETDESNSGQENP